MAQISDSPGQSSTLQFFRKYAYSISNCWWVLFVLSFLSLEIMTTLQTNKNSFILYRMIKSIVSGAFFVFGGVLIWLYKSGVSRYVREQEQSRIHQEASTSKKSAINETLVKVVQTGSQAIGRQSGQEQLLSSPLVFWTMSWKRI